MPLIRFGLLGLMLWRAAIAASRLRRTLGGGTLRLRGRELYLLVTRGKHRIERVSVGIAIPDRFRFLLRRENEIDGLAKWLRLAEEVQTGDAAFDAHVFVVSEDDRLRHAMRSDAQLRAAAASLLADDDVRAVRCNAGKLWIECGSDLDRDVDDASAVEPVAARHIAALDGLASRLAAAPASLWDGNRSPADDREHAIYVVCVALAVGAVAGFFWSQGNGFPRALAYDRAEAVASYFAVAAGLVLVALAIGLLARTSRFHLVLLEIVLAAVPAAWFLARTGLVEHNIRAAQAPPREVVVQIVDRHVHRGRRGRRTYSLTLAGWPDPRVDGRLSVSSDLYSAVAGSDCLRALYAAGRLGDPWIAEAAPERCDAMVR